MKKKILIGAIALMSVFGGITIFESMSGQNEAKANVPPRATCTGNRNQVCVHMKNGDAMGDTFTIYF